MAAPGSDTRPSKARGAARRKPRRGPTRPRRAETERLGLATVLNLVRRHGPLTRLDLERLSGLRRAVVAERLAALTKLGLIREGERGQPTGGRAPRLVEFRADAGLVLVGAIDAWRIGVGVTDLSGKLLTEHHEAVGLAADRQQIGKRLTALFDWILEQHRQGRDVWGIGLAMAGPAEMANGAASSSPASRLAASSEDPLPTQLAGHHRAPVSLRIGVHMRTLGELRSGSAGGTSNLVFVDLGREIAAGLVSDGRLHQGAEGAAGMIGHVAVAEGSGAICRCGNTGCLEAVAGADAIENEALQAARDGRSPALAETLATAGEVTLGDVGLAAQRGDAFSAELLSRCGRLIGGVLATLVNAFNPSLIVLGGEIAETGDIVLAAIREAIYRRSHHLATRDLGVVRSRMGSSAGLVGSALALLDEIFEPEFLKEWVLFGTPLRHPGIEALLAAAGQAPVEGRSETSLETPVGRGTDVPLRQHNRRLG